MNIFSKKLLCTLPKIEPEPTIIKPNWYAWTNDVNIYYTLTATPTANVDYLFLQPNIISDMKVPCVGFFYWFLSGVTNPHYLSLVYPTLLQPGDHIWAQTNFGSYLPDTDAYTTVVESVSGNIVNLANGVSVELALGTSWGATGDYFDETNALRIDNSFYHRYFPCDSDEPINSIYLNT